MTETVYVLAILHIAYWVHNSSSYTQHTESKFDRATQRLPSPDFINTSLITAPLVLMPLVPVILKLDFLCHVVTTQ